VTAPIRTFRPRRLGHPADEVHRRLTAEPQTLAAAATAAALSRSSPLLRRWGLVARTLPTVTAAASGAGELGSLTIRWTGAEDVTGWPAMTAQVLVTPTGPADSELTLATTRPAARGLHASSLSELHRHQATDVLVGSFLHEVADQIERAPAATLARSLEEAGATR
jgi:hypothetical protein